MADDIRIDAVDAPLGGEWAGMTFPLFRPLLSILGTPSRDAQGNAPMACRAIVDGEPAGLVLGHITPTTPDAIELLSIFVAPAHRGQGLATRLVECLEGHALARGVSQMTGSYMTGKPSIPALERVFAKRSFDPPKLRMIVLKFTPEEARECDWYKRARLPQRATIFPWSEVTPDEREWLKRSQAERQWIHPELEPWRCDQTFDDSSVGMRRDGEIVGWVINHRAAPDLVTFTTSFMRADLARRGAIFPLYVASIERLMGTGVICSFVTNAEFDGMVKFALRRGAPFIHYAGETRGVAKQLRASSS
jgi:GNAT superfamily N-acetyltransferase